MKPSVALAAKRHLIRDIAAARRVTNPRIFDLVLQGKDEEGSDLDMRVDVRTPGELPIKFRHQVLEEAQQMRGMRNHMAHGYFDIDLEIVGATLQEAVPQLPMQIQQLNRSL